MLDYEIEERRCSYVYHRNNLRRLTKWLLCSLICTALLIFLSLYSLRRYPKPKLYVTTTAGVLYGVNLQAQPDFSGRLDVGVYLDTNRMGQPTYGVIDGG
jgi:hypothetical protein